MGEGGSCLLYILQKEKQCWERGFGFRDDPASTQYTHNNVCSHLLIHIPSQAHTQLQDRVRDSSQMVSAKQNSEVQGGFSC